MAKQKPEEPAARILAACLGLIDAAEDFRSSLSRGGLPGLAGPGFDDHVAHCLEIVDDLLQPFRKTKR